MFKEVDVKKYDFQNVFEIIKLNEHECLYTLCEGRSPSIGVELRLHSNRSLMSLTAHASTLVLSIELS